MGGVQRKDEGWMQGENGIIGQCEPKEKKASRGFINKQAETVCTGNTQPCV